MAIDCGVRAGEEWPNVGTIGHIDHHKIVILVSSLACVGAVAVLIKDLKAHDEFSPFGKDHLEFLINTCREDFNEELKLLDIKPEPYYTKFNKSRKKGNRNGSYRR